MSTEKQQELENRIRKIAEDKPLKESAEFNKIQNMVMDMVVKWI